VESIEFKSMKLAPALVVRQSSACLTQSEIDKGGGASGKRMTKFEKNEEELVRD
jgi:hypothetical protein